MLRGVFLPAGASAGAGSIKTSISSSACAPLPEWKVSSRTAACDTTRMSGASYAEWVEQPPRRRTSS